MAPRFWFAASHEEFPPSQLLEQAREAERNGFEGIACSDHFAPWFPDGQSGNAWVWLGAAGQGTSGPLGSAVTPVLHRYHPGVIAQAFMTLEELYPGRAFLGAGAGGGVDETPLGLSTAARAAPLHRRGVEPKVVPLGVRPPGLAQRGAPRRRHPATRQSAEDAGD